MNERRPPDFDVFVGLVGKSLLSAEDRLYELNGMLKESTPRSIHEEILKDYYRLWTLQHAAVAAVVEDLISRSLCEEAISREYGQVGLKKLTKILEEHSVCWDRIKPGAIGTWDPLKGYKDGG